MNKYSTKANKKKSPSPAIQPQKHCINCAKLRTFCGDLDNCVSHNYSKFELKESKYSTIARSKRMNKTVYKGR